MLLEYIYEHTNDNRVDLTDMGLKWTWFKDDGKMCGTSSIESISFDYDVNTDPVVFINFNDRESQTVFNLDYEDVLGANIVDYVIGELML